MGCECKFDEYKKNGNVERKVSKIIPKSNERIKIKINFRLRVYQLNFIIVYSQKLILYR